MKKFAKEILCLAGTIFLFISLAFVATAVHSENFVENLIYQKNTPIPQNLPWYPLVVFGDNRPSDTDSIHYPQVFREFVELIEKINPFATLGTGDHTGKGNIEQVNEFVYQTENITNLWVIEGNHDVEDPVGLAFWRKYVAPMMYYRDYIPNWRIILFSTELQDTQLYALKSFLETSLSTNRSVILVFHRPLYPDVGYNLEGAARKIIENSIKRHENVRLVLQGHWHGFAEKIVGKTDFIITAGAGAPLYQTGGEHHFLLLLLFPNGTFQYHPIRIEDRISVHSHSNMVVIENNMTDIWGKEVSIPVRLKFTVKELPLYVVTLAPPGKTLFYYNITHVNRENKITISTDRAHPWYAYIPVLPMAIFNYTGDGGGRNLTIDLPRNPIVLKEHSFIPLYKTETKRVIISKVLTTTKTITKTWTIQETSKTTVTSSTTNISTQPQLTKTQTIIKKNTTSLTIVGVSFIAIILTLLSFLLRKCS